MAVTEITKFQTSDGQLFDTLPAAQDHEAFGELVAELSEDLYQNTPMDSGDAKDTALYLAKTYFIVRKHP